MNKISLLNIHAFKAVQAENIAIIDGLNIVYGASASGKSNFLSIFEFYYHLIHANLQNYIARQPHQASSILFFDSKLANLEIYFGANSYTTKLMKLDEANLGLQHESCRFKSTFFDKHYLNHEAEELYETQILEAYTSHVNSSKSYAKLGNMSEKVEHHTKQLKYLSYIIKPLRQMQVFNFNNLNALRAPCAYSPKTPKLKSDGTNLALVLSYLGESHPEIYLGLLEVYKQLVPDLQNLQIFELNQTLKLKWQSSQHDSWLDLGILTDSALKTLCMLTLIFSPAEIQPSIIAIDDALDFLDEASLEYLAFALGELSNKQQILITTRQKSFFQTHFKNYNLINCQKENYISKFTL
jgi:predicted ATPase